MTKLVCAKCMKVHDKSENGTCPKCGAGEQHVYDFSNSDDYLKGLIPQILEQRKSDGLEGLVDGLDSIIINTEPDRQEAAAKELMRYTGYEFAGASQDEDFRTIILKAGDSADLLITSRLNVSNPFLDHNRFPKSEHLPNTRLETFVFETKDIEKYVSIQKSKGVEFLTGEVMHGDACSFIMTKPSDLSSNSLGFIQWKGERGNYVTSENEVPDLHLEKPDNDYLKNIGLLDHTATRIRARDRDAAVIEFMRLTNYNFDFAIYVMLFNSITSVARLSKDDYAAVFTSGISPFVTLESSGPTEKFIQNYGTRVHHMAFVTEQIEETVSSLREDGMDFLIELVGSLDEGLKQTFSAPSKDTLLVNEYIQRYGDFDGFFTKSNVTLLTEVTDLQ